MTQRTRRTFTDKFKQEAVVLLGSSELPLGQIAADLGIQLSLLRNGPQRFDGPGGARCPSRPTTIRRSQTAPGPRPF
jgi:transposase-like protein